MEMKETEFRGARILQHDLLLNCADLFHAVFLNDTPHTKVPDLVRYPLFQVEQIHSALLQPLTNLGPCDGIYTQDPQKTLLIKHADCQAAIFWDPIRKQLACVHAGWKGLVKQIYTETVLIMKAQGSNPADILVGIGPSMGPEASEFKGWQSYFPPHFTEFQWKENYFDLRAVAKNELLSLGILPAHLSISELCTVNDPSRFYSWRRDKTELRHATLAYFLV